ncbi:MAG: cell division protein ZapA [Chitinophagales bacterium]|nr:cell division protein ZapA [Chitinophagales bacterium]
MEHNESLQHIQVAIAGRQYPLKIRKGEEEKVQRAVALVNDKINEYQQVYAGKDRQDYLAMCVLMLAVEYEALKTGSLHQKSNESEQLSEINQLLEAVLS